MAEAALLLAGADSLEQLAEVVAGAGLAALGGQGGAIAVVDDDGMIRCRGLQLAAVEGDADGPVRR